MKRKITICIVTTNDDGEHYEQKQVEVPMYFRIGNRLFKVNKDGSHFSHYREGSYASKDLWHCLFCTIEEHIDAIINGTYEEASEIEWLSVVNKLYKYVTE